MASTLIDRLDGLSSSAAIKGPVRCASTTNIVLSGLQTMDGVALASGDRVLVKDQTEPIQNGIWVCDTGPWRRSADFSKARDVVFGTAVAITEGSQNANKLVQVVSSDVNIGVSPIAFALLVASGSQGGKADSAVQPGAPLVTALEAAVSLLPTSLPAQPGKFWINGGILAVS